MEFVWRKNQKLLSGQGRQNTGFSLTIGVIVVADHAAIYVSLACAEFVFVS